MKIFLQKLPIILLFLLFIPLTVLFAVEAKFSLDWRMVHDSPILYYMGYLVSQFGAVPYRDFFDMNMPGAHWFNALVGTIFGFTDFGFQRANLLILLVTMGLMFYWLKSFGFWPGLAGSILFGVFFFQYGPVMSMQREFITLPFILAALIIFPYAQTSNRLWRYLIAGILIGLSVLIKPQSGLMFLVLAVCLFYIFLIQKSKAHSFILPLIVLSIGLAIPLLVTFVYFLTSGSLDSFLEIALRYWPLYNAINARLEITSGFNEILVTLNGLSWIGINGLWFAPALVSVTCLTKNQLLARQERLKTYVMIGGVLASFIEVIVANKYWEYHWLPMLTFLIMLSAAGLASPPFLAKSKSTWPVLCSIFIAIVFIIRPPASFWEQIQSRTPSAPQGGRVDEIASYLKENLDPGDTVQPLDWTNGAVQSMLITRALPASRYLYDFYFFHHVSNPEIQFIRQDLIKQLGFSKPKVVIQFYDGRPWVGGLDTTREFPELQQFLTENYYVDKDKNGYRLWMRK